MNRPIAIVGAPSSIGIRPYDDGRARHLDQAPRALRDLGLVERLRARDLGDVAALPYRDFVRPAGKPRNEEAVADYCRTLAERVAAAAKGDRFVLVLGGDCSIVLGCLLGLRRGVPGALGLAYVDAHADFAVPSVSRTGSAASMCLALAVGRGDTPLARLAGDDPLVREEDVTVIGRRDQAEEPLYGPHVLGNSAIQDLPHHLVRSDGPTRTARAALTRLGGPGLSGFWIHMDADVLDPGVMPAVDTPERDGLGIDELAELLAPLVEHPRALGLELTIYDPALDPDGACAVRLAALLERLLGG